MKKVLRKIFILSAVSSLTACAGFGPAMKANQHASHRANVAPYAMHERMQSMRDKMMNARTPQERQALMEEHRKTMQDGIHTMKEMGGMHGMGDAMGMRLDMMQTMMEMMMQRMPADSAPPPAR